MKFLLLRLTVACCLLSIGANAQQDQERLDLPGDNLNLYAVLKLFQESETLEGFEKALNDENNNINNLDLDGDNQTDYIQVVDNVDGNIHNIVLKVAVSNDEDQDVAVIVVEKERDGEAKIQLIGDEDLYGKDYIVEPNYASADSGGTPNPGYSGNTNAVRSNNIQYTTTYQVATWPIVSFMFVPSYVVWRSPWHWSYYPSYWRPWRPIFWHQYYGYHYYWDYYYFGHYRRWHYYRFPGWRDRYYGGSWFRRSAPIVRTRYQRGDYRTTYSRPDLAKTGYDKFKRDYPKAPSVNKKPPTFDKGGRPVVTRPTRPGTTKPGTTKPGITRPGVTNPGTTRPITKPGTPTTKPVTRPITKPTNPTTKPITRPTNPSTRPVTKPVTRPTVKPSRPTTRPSVQPAEPATRPAVRPATRPTTRPVEKPANGQK